MSISRLRRGHAEAGPGAEGGGAYVLPPTVSRAALMENGCDRRFRALVNDLFTIASRMETLRAHLGARIGISGPQYSVLVAVAHLQGELGVSVGTVAQAMHVSSAFIASETGKMARRKLLLKRANPEDRRGVLLSVAPAGRLRIDRVGADGEVETAVICPGALDHALEGFHGIVPLVGIGAGVAGDDDHGFSPRLMAAVIRAAEPIDPAPWRRRGLRQSGRRGHGSG